MNLHNPLHINQPSDVKSFLLKNYVVLFGVTIFVTLFLGAVISTYQMRSVHKLFVERLNKIIELHKNELLNEIALEDDSSLKQHIDLLKNQLSADEVVLKFNDKKIESTSSGFNEESISVVQQIILFPIGVKPLTVEIANDFDSINASLKIYYDSGFFDWVIKPFLETAAAIFLLSLIPMALIFIYLFGFIKKRFISPLRDVTKSLTEQKPIDPKLLNDGAIGEIKELAEASVRFKDVQREAAFSEMAHLVAHDIRSPLVLLGTLAQNTQGIPEENRRILKSVVDRINSIASGLLEKNKTRILAPKPKKAFVLSVIEKIVSEKQVIHRSKSIDLILNIQKDAARKFIGIDAVELARALANLIDNAVEAYELNEDFSYGEEKKKIKIELKSDAINHMVSIIVGDSGRGIPKEILGRIGEKGLTFGKLKGNGLGLYQAKTLVESVGGKLIVESEENKGTRIELRFPEVKEPQWCANSIRVFSDQRVVSIDDDSSIHSVWKLVFENKLQKTFLDFDEELNGLVDDRSLLFLVDNSVNRIKSLEENKQAFDGIDFIEKHNLAERAILVTNDYDDEELQNRCIRAGCKLFPKNVLPYLKVDKDLTREIMSYDLALIDNDELARMTWELRSQNQNKKVGIFETMGEFLNANVSCETPVYIDYRLDEGVLGVDVASTLSNRGYKNLILTTGEEKISNVPSFIKEVRGKEFPF